MREAQQPLNSIANWKYRGEGNCSLVVFNETLGTIYRFLKTTPVKPSLEILENTEAEAIHNDKKYTKLVEYAENVMAVLYGSYMALPKIRSIDPDLLMTLRNRIEQERPVNRRHKTISLSHVVLEMPDYAFLPCSYRNLNKPSFLFELKPESITRFYSNSSPEEATSHSCFFCIVKMLKSTGDLPVTRYCPKDLYSGNPAKMRLCLQHLLEDISCSRNRLRVFKNGVNIMKNMQSVTDLERELAPYFESEQGCSSYTEVVDVVQKCLLHTHPEKIRDTISLVPSASGATISNRKFTRYASQYDLPFGCVLDVLMRAQLVGGRSLNKVKCAFEALCKEVEADHTIMDRLCFNGPYGNNLWSLEKLPDAVDGISQSLMDMFITVRNYLIYRTARDSSILITVQPMAEDCPDQSDSSLVHVTDSSGQRYLCHTALIDFDPKSFHKMKEYLEREEYCGNVITEANLCVNQSIEDLGSCNDIKWQVI